MGPAIKAQTVQQGPRREVMRGRVLTDSGVAIGGASVVATASLNHESHSTRTDTVGRYEIVFERGTGDYTVQVSAAGRKDFQTRVSRTNADSVLLMNVRLAPTTQQVPQLGRVRVQANRRQKPPIQDNSTPGIGATQQQVGLFGTAPSDQGDLAAMAASLPGVTLVPNADGSPAGFSVLGLPPSQNLATLNGLNFGGAQVPMAAFTTTQLQTSAYDASVGGFSGGLLSVTLGRGPDYSLGNATVLFDDPALQLTDPTGALLGQRYRNIQLSASRAGPFIRNKLFYNVSGQGGRRTSDLVTLDNADAASLATVGVSDQTVKGLLQTLDGLRGFPLQAGAAQVVTTNASALGRFDILPTANRTLNVTLNGAARRASPVQAGLTTLASQAGTLDTWNGGAQLDFARYVADFYLVRARSGISSAGSNGAAAVRVPEGRVLVGSLLPNGEPGLATLGFGGSSRFPRRTRNWTWQTTTEASWFLPDNRHRPKVAAGAQLDGYAGDEVSNRLGSFTFNSLDDLARGRPAMFSRTLSGGQWRSREASGWVSLGDLWRVTDRFSVQFGLRGEANHYPTAPAYNPLVDSLFQVRTDRVPNSVRLSPRFGFTWAYGRESRINGFGARPKGSIHGGFGEFRSILPVALIGPALAGSGLPGALQHVTCVGPAAPVPEWADYVSDVTRIPTACVDGVGANGFSDAEPNVTFFLPNYDAARARRASLGWSGRLLPFARLSADAIYSRNVNQPGSIDVNFNATPRFMIPAEGGRQAFADPDRIYTATGGIDPLASRLSPRLSRVVGLTSDLRSETRQLQLTLRPSGFFLTRYWFLNYAYTRARDQVRGFDGAALGDPGLAAWGISTGDIRHALTGTLSWEFGDGGNLSLTGQVHSGIPFTPLVQGDINGDGLSNDRAFVFDPAIIADPAFAGDMAELFRGVPRSVRECLDRQLGHVAERNSCRGPWTSAAWLTMSTSGRSFGLTDRARLSLTANNLFAGFDQILHGGAHIHGWGQPAVPDPNLLVVKGFDPAARSFRYAVNPSFGDTRPLRSALRTPFRLTFAVSLTLGSPYQRQLLDDVLAPGRSRRGDRLTAAQIGRRYENSGFYDPVPTLLAATDSLLLTSDQAAQLRQIGKRYTAATDSIWRQLGVYLAALDTRYDENTALRRTHEAKLEAYAELEVAAGEINSILSPEQMHFLAPEIQAMLDVRSIERMRRRELRSY
ncbi:MAG: carboxypeptidase regulatory-like domain-containing protein [Gemmatimonadaceae bacterium]